MYKESFSILNPMALTKVTRAGLGVLLCTASLLSASHALAWGKAPVADKPKANIQLAAAETKVSINKADAATLADVLTGIGLKKAERIVAWRKQNGDFKSLDQLLDIKGIGEKTLSKNRHKLKL